MSNNLSWGSGPVQARLVCGNLPLTQTDLLSFSHTAACCDGDIGLGQVCAATIQATVTGQRDLLGESLTAQLGEDSGGSLVWRPLGTFVVTECRRGEDSTALTACDAAWYALAGQYVPTVQSGATVYAVLEDLASQCSLTVEQTTLNYGLQIPVTGTLTGHSCREMLGYLAALCGRNCVISREGAVRFVWFSASDAVVTAQRSYAGEHTHSGLSRVAGLRCTVPNGEGDLTLVAGDADKALELTCPFMTQSRLSELWTQLGGYSYPVLEVHFYGGAEVQPGDLVTVTDRDGVSVSLPAMEVSLSVDGACRCQLRSFGQGDECRVCDHTGPVAQRLRRVQSTADTALLGANGKNKNFYQASAPASSAGLTAGDLWFDTANGNRVSEWTEGSWVQRPFGSAAVTSLDAGSITTGTLNAARIGSGSITADKLDVNDLFSQNITVTGSFQVQTDHYKQIITNEGYNLRADGEYQGQPVEASLRLYDQGMVGMFGTHQANLLSDGTVTLLGNRVTLQARQAPVTVYGSLCQGIDNVASGNRSHAEGDTTSATGENAHAEGSNTTASGSYAHAQNLCTIAQGSAQTALGKYNVSDTTSLVIIGNGTSSYARSNALTVAQDGTVNMAGVLQRHGNPYLKVVNKSFSVTCPGSSAKSGSGSVTLTGYTPLGVVGFNFDGTNSSQILPFRVYLDGSTLRWNVRNFISTDFSGTISASILYMAV